MLPAATYASARMEAIANTLPPNARLLVQVGAGDGALARHYHSIYPTTSFVVVESDPAAARRALRFADRVIQVALDQADASLFRHLQWADGWLFDLTLADLQQPAQVLAAIRAVIQYDACLLVCVPDPGDALAALNQLFAEAGFRLSNTFEFSPGVGAAPDHYLIKAMPAG